MFTLICWYKKGRLTVSKREVYEQKTEELLLPIVESNGFELVDVEYVKEGGNWYLRAYIDKPGGISVDDCEVVSRAFSDILDEKDCIGEEVEIRTYRAIDRQKEFIGILKEYDQDTVTIEYEDETTKTFERSEIALIRLALDF